MRTVKIKRTSWHYRLMHWMGACPENDICSYVSDLVMCIGLLTCGVALSSFTIYAFGNMFGWLAAMIAYLGWIPPDGSGGAVSLVIAAAGIIGACWFLWQRVEKTEFISAAFDSVANGICCRIEVED